VNQPLDARSANSYRDGPSFDLRNRMTRLAWKWTWCILASWSQPFHGWRRFLLRLFGAKIGKGANISPSAKIWLPSNLVIDDYAAIGESADIYCMAKVYIGKHAIVSKGAHICAGTHNIDDVFFQLVTKEIRIGDYAWVAADAFVGPGVTLGEGAVLGACGVAARPLSEWGVYAGNPAQFIRSRVVNRRN
jgi:putative colanic acid biosynthesis acetyltransferase WcaF